MTLDNCVALKKRRCPLTRTFSAVTMQDTPSGLPRVLAAALLLLFLCGCSTKSKEELLANGMAELKKGNPNGAVVCFKSALESDPKFFEARHQLAKAYASAGKPELAIKEFTRLISDDATRSGAKLELARVYIAGGKPEQSQAETAEYVKRYGATSETYELLGLASAAMGKLDAAEDNLQKSLQLEPSRSAVKLSLANLYQMSRKKGKEGESKRLVNEVIAAEPKNLKAYFMLALMESSAGNTDAAIATYRKIIEIDSDNITALYKCGLLYVAKGDIQQADQTAEAIIEKFPKRSEGLRLKGIVAYHGKKFSEAITGLQEANSKQPSAEAYYYLGLCHFSIGELELALSQFKRVDERSSFSGPARILSAMTLLRQQRFADAAAEMKIVLAANPGNAFAHNVLGSALIGMNLHDEGMAEFNRAIELDRRVVDAHMSKGKVNLFMGKVKDAENDFISALQVSPELLNSRLILASLYAREKNHDKALALLEKGLSNRKDDAIIYNYMAAIMFSRAKNEEALKYLLSAKKADPSYLTASFNIATYYSAMNDHGKAFAEYEEILQKSPQNAKAMISVAALQELRKDDKEALRYYNKALKTKDQAAYLAIAYYYLRKGDKKKALSSLDKGIRVVARNIEAMEMKRQILTAESKYDEALKVCDDMETVNPQLGMHKKIETYLLKKDTTKAKEHALRYITLNPSSASGYLYLAIVYDYSGDLDKAIDEIKKGIKVDRQNVAPLQKLGDLYVRKKDYKAAMNVYKEILQKNPDYIPAMFSHARVLEETGKKNEAKNEYREILVKSENYVPALNNLAYLNVDGFGSAQEGLRLAFLSSRLNPSSPEVMDTLGYALLKNGRPKESQEMLEKAAKLLPGNATVTYHLALACLANGAREQGLTLLQSSLKMGDFPEAELARKLLGQSGKQ